VVDEDTGRVTAPWGPTEEPPGWWEEFWVRHEANTGQTRAEALDFLRSHHGSGWYPACACDLEAALQAD